MKQSPINYFSDLFVAVMVLAWMVVIIIMIAVGIFATVRYQDTSIWSYVDNLVTVPLSCGGAIWMLKNSVQHAIANNKGKQAHMDFPAVNAEGQDDGIEVEMESAVEDNAPQGTTEEALG